jgi:hypothetical protein
MTTGDSTTSSSGQRPAWTTELERAYRREQPLTWSVWAAPMYDSSCLTPEGLQVAEWVVDVLQRFLGTDFLQRILDAGVEHHLLSNALGAAIWPIVDGRGTYINLFHLGAQVALAQTSYAPLQAHARNVKNPSDWIHVLAQLETAGLAARDGWRTTFETLLEAVPKPD